MRALIHRDMALRHRDASATATQRDTNVCKIYINKTHNKKHEVGYNRTGRRTDADARSQTLRKKGVGWRCCRKHSGIPQSSASLPKPAQKEATESMEEREAFDRQPNSTSSSLILRSLFSSSSPSLYRQEGSRFLLTSYLPNLPT